MPPAAKPSTRSIPMTREQIRAELAHMFGVPQVADGAPINNYITGGPGAVAAFWEPLVEWPTFAQHGLWLGPHDLRFVTTIGELASVIDWALRHARR